MKHVRTSLVLFCIGLSILTGCDRQQEQSISRNETKNESSIAHDAPTVFLDALEPDVYELPSGALATWRAFASARPRLLLFSAHPFLERLAAEAIPDIRQVVLGGDDREVVRRGQVFVADPVLFPLQTVSAALAANLLSEVVVVLPLRTPAAEMDLAAIRKWLTEKQFLTDAESSDLTLQDGIVSGSVRGIPLKLVHPDKLPEFNEPVMLHIDLGYFKNLYVNEVRTPAYTLLFNMAETIRRRHLKALAATLSYSNREIGLSLDSRFLIRHLSDLLRNPALLAGQQPDSWKILAESLKLNAMFMEGNARSLIINEAERGKNDPAYLYALATALFQNRNAREGFATLDRAVALDDGYGVAYLDLAQTGEEQGRHDKALELLDKAARTFPDDPFIRLQQAEYLIRLGRGKEARPIIEDLKQQPWSQRIYADMPAFLDDLLKDAQNRSVKPGPENAGRSSRDPS